MYKRRVTYLGNAYHESNLYLKNNDLLSYQIPIMQEILIKVHGSSFVYNQIRNMVGYFVQVGTGNEDPALTTTHLNEKKRLPYTAPPTGLALMKVHYNESELDVDEDNVCKQSQEEREIHIQTFVYEVYILYRKYISYSCSPESTRVIN